jgi:hypothetical protein
MTPEKKEEDKKKEIERVQAIMMNYSKRVKEALDPLLQEIRGDIKKGEVNIANNKAQATIFPILFSLPPANAMGVLDILRMDIGNSIAKTRKPIQVVKKSGSGQMFA